MIALVDEEIQLIELVTHVAQQVQRGKDASAHLAYLNRIFQEKKPEAALLNTLITSLDVPQLRRFLRRGRPDSTSSTPPAIPGKRLILYKAPLPGETQARIATDSLIARYLSWLARNSHRRAVAVIDTDRHVVLFVPDESEFNPEQAWHEFIAFVFSGENSGVLSLPC
jgi:hypothetical protein